MCEANVESIAFGLNSVLEEGYLAGIQEKLPELKKQFSWASMALSLESRV